MKELCKRHCPDDLAAYSDSNKILAEGGEDSDADDSDFEEEEEEEEEEG